MCFAATKDTEASRKLVQGCFSENLTPHDLCDWLARELKAKGLVLTQEQRDKLLGKF